MTAAAYAAVDWGTSSFRLWIISESGAVLAERRSSEGMTTAAQSGFSAILESHLAAVSAPPHLPVIICGMAGARQGWVEAGYLDTPAPLAGIVKAAVTVPDANRDIRILPGLAQRDQDRPDVIRGEETQLLGAISQLGGGSHLVCMPGTHSKWVRVTGGIVDGFSTFMTGELFDVISKHSILSHAVADGGAFDAADAGFLSAVANAAKNPAMATNLLFTVRSGQLLHGLTAPAAKARLSGTMIGLEIAGALSTAKPGAKVCLVASGPLAALYQSALSTLDLTPVTIDADDAVRHGLAAAAQAIWPA
ncbi:MULTISPECIES: 2-dehydro-3-deoxygalactonokinase [unclassified Rhizobium]|uniref:2-dehydro-3-deoxygalactonokinase n=1 Tax=unclassified Rhizobium TaxID=2613769 RepID=UPI000713139C|nr:MULTISPECIES: 2-dehydro-3-deoxygalactonokinase [unclassified Rhizobium]KQS96208.1 2-dehydro-3-deoxygalactonokinase [Rhizobium sp. Leaf386]KQT06046.1 2-dehydro-3-deoxygalactonokinase [Rhizobium sp. Leaf391]KQU09717.1 2-dehydro-3-deoxygalactonokinase [Rhizobium sp. Leaf453]